MSGFIATAHLLALLSSIFWSRTAVNWKAFPRDFVVVVVKKTFWKHWESRRISEPNRNVLKYSWEIIVRWIQDRIEINLSLIDCVFSQDTSPILKWRNDSLNWRIKSPRRWKKQTVSMKPMKLSWAESKQMDKSLMAITIHQTEFAILCDRWVIRVRHKNHIGNDWN